jgi:hypothetical protein
LDQKKGDREPENALGFESMMARLSARFVKLPASQVNSVIHEGQPLICQSLNLVKSFVSSGYRISIQSRKFLTARGIRATSAAAWLTESVSSRVA